MGSLPTDSQPNQSRKSTKARVTEPASPSGNEAPQSSGAVSVSLQNKKLKALINLESEARTAADAKELAYVISNNTRAVLPVRQVFVFKQKAGTRYQLNSISSVADVERSAFMVRALEKLIQQMAKLGKLDAPNTFDLNGSGVSKSEDWKNYPFKQFHWQPFSAGRSGRFAGMLLARETPWTEKDTTIAAHLAEIYGHAWRALIGERGIRKINSRKRLWMAAFAAAFIFCGFIPVPLTALAPAEITAKDAIVIAAPINGIIDEILVSPNIKVVKGQALIRYEDTTLRNDVVVAEKNVDIAQARERQFNQSAFSDEQASRNLTVATRELELANAQLIYNRDVLAKAVIQAPQNGIAVFNDPDEWKGRPVSVGTRILTIADPKRIELEVYLPVSDAIILKAGSRVRFFLDTSPLDPLEAELVSASYQASPTQSGTLAYNLRARLILDGKDTPRIGLRGVAQLFGSDVTLFFFLLRRPIATLRQFFGI